MVGVFVGDKNFGNLRRLVTCRFERVDVIFNFVAESYDGIFVDGNFFFGRKARINEDNFFAGVDNVILQTGAKFFFLNCAFGQAAAARERFHHVTAVKEFNRRNFHNWRPPRLNKVFSVNHQAERRNARRFYKFSPIHHAFSLKTDAG